MPLHKNETVPAKVDARNTIWHTLTDNANGAVRVNCPRLV
jgi:hypothetical protein